MYGIQCDGMLYALLEGEKFRWGIWFRNWLGVGCAFWGGIEDSGIFEPKNAENEKI